MIVLFFLLGVLVDFTAFAVVCGFGILVVLMDFLFLKLLVWVFVGLLWVSCGSDWRLFLGVVGWCLCFVFGFLVDLGSGLVFLGSGVCMVDLLSFWCVWCVVAICGVVCFGFGVCTYWYLVL